MECLKVPVQLPKDRRDLEELSNKAKDWTLLSGGAVRKRDGGDCFQCVSFTLLPSPVDRVNFHKAVKAQTVFNLLVHRVAHSTTFLTSCLKNTIKVDPFTAKLFDIYQTVNREGIRQPLSLGLLRSDYLSDWDGCFRQVEINTVAVSLASLAQVVYCTHKYVLEELGQKDKWVNLPENGALRGSCDGLIKAWELYGDPKSIVLFVVEEVTYNISDQRLLEYEINKRSPGLRVYRRTFLELSGKLELTEDGVLQMDGCLNVAVVYYRTGYDPAEYNGEQDWDTRLIIERSRAIKCPSIQYHLAGTKKVQQVLSKKGVLEEFLSSYEDVQLARSMFTSIHSLDFDSDGDEGVRLAMVNPSGYVLKPQREGGGNNVYGEEVAIAVESLGTDRPGWVLMERIRPRAATGYIVRAGEPTAGASVVSELGIYGVIIGTSEEIVTNLQIGHIMRTKPASSDEGGVCGGSGAVDTPYLI